MKNLNANLMIDILSDYMLSNEEMICIHGGEGDAIIKTILPPVVI